jgi:hypothetical protein
VILAELEVFHSRIYSPTRRIALGRRDLPTDPDFGPLLLGGIVAISAEQLDPDLGPELERLLFQLDHGERVVQPRLRNRFQSDHHGLARTSAALVGLGEQLDFDLDGYGSPLQMTLAAAYAGGQLAPTARHRTFAMIRKAIRWRGEFGAELLAHLSGDERPPAWSAVALVDPVRWAKEILGFDIDVDDDLERRTNGDAGDARPSRRDVQRRYRQALRQAHPDHGGDSDDAAARIGDLAQARRILLG